jgi:hypothetical protein
LVETSERGVELLEFVKCRTSITVGHRALWVDVEGFLEPLHGFSRIIRLSRNDAEQIQRVEMPRLCLQYFFINELRMCQFTLPLQGQCLLEFRGELRRDGRCCRFVLRGVWEFAGHFSGVRDA